MNKSGGDKLQRGWKKSQGQKRSNLPYNTYFEVQDKKKKTSS